MSGCVKLLLFFILTTLAPTMAAGHVHRRSVGPVILDIGPLPPAPAQPETKKPVEESSVVHAAPADPAPPDMNRIETRPQTLPTIFPSHQQPLGALVLTLHTPTDHAVESTSIMSMTSLPPQIPALVAWRNPTLAQDYALLTSTIESPPPPPVTAPPPMVDPPLTRLRSLVMWIWRLLFVIGVGAMILLFRRHREKSGRPASPATPSDTPSETDTGLDIAGSRSFRPPPATAAIAADSLSLMAGKPTTTDTPEKESRDFGLIEPGAGPSVAAVKERLQGRRGSERQSSS